MRRWLGSVAFFIFMTAVSTWVVNFATIETQATENGNYWDGKVSVTTSERAVDDRYAFHRYDCVPSSDLKQKVFGFPYTTAFDSVPLIDSTSHESIADACLIYNPTLGVFSSESMSVAPKQRTKLYGANKQGLMESLRPANQVKHTLDPAPNGPNVLDIYKPTNFDYYNIGLFTDYSKGNQKVESNRIYWNPDSGAIREPRNYTGSDPNVADHQFSPNGQFLVIRTGTNVGVVNLANLAYTPVYYAPNLEGSHIAVSNNGQYVAVYKNGLRVIDTSGCEATYTQYEWDTRTKTTLPGCKVGGNLESTFNASVATDQVTIDLLHRFRFDDVKNDIFYISVGTKKSATSQSKASTAYSWKEYKLQALDYVSTAAGYIALGDSYSSGEGELDADWYEPGTDEQGDEATYAGRNLCHVSRRSYPYLIAKELGYLSGAKDSKITPPENGLFHSVACSGALLHNVIGAKGEKQNEGTAIDFVNTDNQYRYNDRSDASDVFQNGTEKQLGFLEDRIFSIDDLSVARKSISPEVLTIGIVGNDLGFGDYIGSCILPGTCGFAVEGSDEQQKFVKRIAAHKSYIKRIFSEIKTSAPSARIYVHGYPEFLLQTGGNCAPNVLLNTQERFAAVELIRYTNSVVESAAREAGVFYVDISSIFEGVNLCSEGDVELVFNGVTKGNDSDPIEGTPYDALIPGSGICIGKCVGSETYHPNKYGHELYTEAILDQTNNLTASMPEPEATKIPTPQEYFGEDIALEVLFMNGGDISYVPFKSLLAQSIDAVERNFNLQSDPLFAPGSEVLLEMHSTPIQLGIATADIYGSVSFEGLLPDGVTPGYHEIHMYGIDHQGREVDVYDTFVLGESIVDFDGDGVIDENDSCIFVSNSGLDVDGDSVDDACDNEVTATMNDDQSGEDNTPEDPLTKGEISDETVAGTNEPLLTGSVLGAATDTIDDGSSVLSGTGDGIAYVVFTGSLLASMGVVVGRSRNK